jgi:hypothetical protein
MNNNICKICDKKFEPNKYTPNQIYCSKKCKSLGKRLWQKKYCKTNKGESVKLNFYEKHPNYLRLKYGIGKKLYERNLMFEKGLLLCCECKEILPLSKFHKDATCSNGYDYRCKKCVNKKHIAKPKKIHNKKLCKCVICRTLRGEYKGRNHPRFGKVTHPKYIKYKNIRFHSSWESKYAEHLDELNIKWKYEPKAFDLGETTYTPDFYLPETDTYVEIKGWWRDDAKSKFKMFRIKYPKINIKVYRQNHLRRMKVIK